MDYEVARSVKRTKKTLPTPCLIEQTISLFSFFFFMEQGFLMDRPDLMIGCLDLLELFSRQRLRTVRAASRRDVVSDSHRERY